MAKIVWMVNSRLLTTRDDYNNSDLLLKRTIKHSYHLDTGSTGHGTHTHIYRHTKGKVVDSKQNCYVLSISVFDLGITNELFFKAIDFCIIKIYITVCKVKCVKLYSFYLNWSPVVLFAPAVFTYWPFYLISLREVFIQITIEYIQYLI